MLPGTPLFVHIWPLWLNYEPGKRFSNYGIHGKSVVPQVGPFISDLSLFRGFLRSPMSANEEPRDQEKLLTTWKQKGNVLNRALCHSQHYLQNDLPTRKLKYRNGGFVVNTNCNQLDFLPLTVYPQEAYNIWFMILLCFFPTSRLNPRSGLNFSCKNHR